MNEIERKFIVKYIPLEVQFLRIESIEQYYLKSDIETRIRHAEVHVCRDTITFKDMKDSWSDQLNRIEAMGNEITHTTKKPTADFAVREEVERPITLKEYQDYFIDLPFGVCPLRKTRYYIKTKYKFESIDIYHENLPCIFEVEFNSIEEKNAFDPRMYDWLGQEVTGIPGYSNKDIYNALQPKEA